MEDHSSDRRVRPTENRADRYWRDIFGLSPEAFGKTGILVSPHSGHLAGRNAAWVFRHGHSCIVSVPAPMVDELERSAPGLEIERIHESESIRRLFGDRIERTVGPSYQGVCEREDFRPRNSPEVRRLVPADGASLEGLVSACPESEWEESGVDLKSEPLFGYFVGEQITAVGGAIPWAPDAANLAVITHPEHRGKGYATPVVSAVMSHILGEGKAVLYQTLLSNAPAVRIAEKLGCRLYATLTFVALSGPR